MESNELFLPEIDKPTKASPFSQKDLEVISPPIRRVRTQNSQNDRESMTQINKFKPGTEYRNYPAQFSMARPSQHSEEV